MDFVLYVKNILGVSSNDLLVLYALCNLILSFFCYDKRGSIIKIVSWMEYFIFFFIINFNFIEKELSQCIHDVYFVIF